METFRTVFDHTIDWYHGTLSTEVASLKEGIKVDHSKRNCDFGIGFYLTSRKKQAIKWAKRKLGNIRDFDSSVHPVVLTYKLSGQLVSDIKVFEIEEKFFDFIYCNRVKLDAKKGKNTHVYPMVFGPVIDGQITQLKEILSDYQKQEKNLDEVAERLLGNYPEDNQLCICHQDVADRLVLVGEETIDVNRE